MAYTLRSNGKPISTIPFFPNAGLLGFRPRRGLGNFSVQDMIANCGGGSGSQNCDPHDSSCVAVAGALSIWAQNELEANYPYGPATMPDCPDLSNTAAITDAFMHNAPLSLGPQTGPGTSTPIPAQTATGPGIQAQYAVGPNGQHIISAQATQTGTLYIWSDMTQSTTTQYTGQPYTPPAAYNATPTNPSPTPVQTTPPVTLVTTTNSGSSAPAATVTNNAAPVPSTSTYNVFTAPSGTVASSDWFTQSMFDGIPNWVLLAAGVGLAALFFMGGKHGR